MILLVRAVMADEFVKSILTEWGMENYIETFNEEQIDEEAFRLLDDNTIMSLLKKAGHVLKFKKKFQQFLLIDNWVDRNEQSTSTVTVSTEDASPSTSFTSSFSDFIYLENEPSSNEALQDPKTTPSFILMPPPPPPPPLPVTNLVLNEEVPIKKRKICLEGLLKQTVEGRKILSKKAQGFLDNNLRNKLSNLIVSHLINTDKRYINLRFSVYFLIESK